MLCQNCLISLVKRSYPCQTKRANAKHVQHLIEFFSDQKGQEAVTWIRTHHLRPLHCTKWHAAGQIHTLEDVAREALKAQALPEEGAREMLFLMEDSELQLTQ